MKAVIARFMAMLFITMLLVLSAFVGCTYVMDRMIGGGK